MTARRRWRSERHAGLAAAVTVGAVILLFGVMPVGDGVGMSLMLAALLVVAAIVIKNGDPVLGRILLVAIGLRAAAAIAGTYVLALPDSGKDAIAFERDAYQLAEMGFFNLVEFVFTEKAQGPTLYSALLAMWYSLLGVQSILVGLAINVLFGTLTVYNVWRVADRLWGRPGAAFAGWLAAFFPTLVLYSAVFLREAPIHWLLSLAAFHLVEWRRTRRAWRVAAAFASVTVAAMFHSGAIVALVGVAAMLAVSELSRVTDVFTVMRERFAALLRVAALAAVILVLFATGITSQKVGDPLDLTEVSRRQFYLAEGDSAYLKEVRPESWFDVAWQGPIRMVFVLASPFVWQVTETFHLVGLLDVAFQLYLLGVLFHYRRPLWRLWEARVLIITYFSLAFAFGMGSSNFGTAIRHRAKFVWLLIMLVGVVRMYRADGRPIRPPPPMAAAPLPARAGSY